MHKGSCLCQAVAFEIEGEFEKFFLCHCSRCRKTSGSAHCANLFASQAKYIIVRGREEITRFELDGTRFKRSFCRICSGTLPTQNENGLLLVPAGSLDTPLAIRPQGHIFCGSRADWDKDLAEIPKFDALPSI